MSEIAPEVKAYIDAHVTAIGERIESVMSHIQAQVDIKQDARDAVFASRNDALRAKGLYINTFLKLATDMIMKAGTSDLESIIAHADFTTNTLLTFIDTKTVTNGK